MKEWKIGNLDTLLYYQAAGPCVPKDMFLCVAPVLCLSISTGEKYYMVNSLHSFLNYIWISDRKSSAPFSSPPTPSPSLSPIPHPIPSTPTPLCSLLRVLNVLWSNKGSGDIQAKWTLIIITTQSTAWHLHKERRHIKGKVARQQGDAPDIFKNEPSEKRKAHKSNKLTEEKESKYKIIENK